MIFIAVGFNAVRIAQAQELCAKRSSAVEKYPRIEPAGEVPPIRALRVGPDAADVRLVVYVMDESAHMVITVEQLVIPADQTWPEGSR